MHRGLPSRHLTVIITLDGTVDLVDMAGPTQVPTSFSTLAGGLHATPALISHDGHQHGIHLHLTPLGARVLLGLPAGELANTVVELGTLLGPVAGELIERLRSACTWTERFLELDAVLARIATQRARPAPELGWAWQRLRETAGGVGVQTLATEVGWSRRHLTDRFHQEYGLPPKVAARVLRFERAVGQMRSSARPRLADIAVRCGYADQAHLTREWQAIAGCTPRRWIAEELPYVQDFDAARGHSEGYE